MGGNGRERRKKRRKAEQEEQEGGKKEWREERTGERQEDLDLEGERGTGEEGPHQK